MDNAQKNSNEAAFGPSSGNNNVIFAEHPNYEALKAAHAKAFEELSTRRIDTLTRNELAFIRVVSNGSIKTSQLAGKCAYDLLAGVKLSTNNSLTDEKVKQFIASMPEDQRILFLAALS